MAAGSSRPRARASCGAPTYFRQLHDRLKPGGKAALQVITIGMAHPALTFTGWSDVELSDGSIQRGAISENVVGNNTLVLHAQAFKACEVSNTGGRGTLSLRLLADGDTVYEHSVAYPAVTIHYP